MKPYTGGELNWLNGRYGISAPQNSVPVMKLIRTHRPATRSGLYEQIRFHFETACPCGIRSRGTIEDFGKNLYEAQIKAWGYYKYSLKSCIQWEYDLFVSQSLKGRKIEKNAMRQLSGALPGIQFSEAEGYLDEKLRVDILIHKDGGIIGGIQVKPQSYTHMRQGVIHRNIVSNQKWGRAVFYLFYDNREQFINMVNVLDGIIYQAESRRIFFNNK